jgi:hypothetical protein
VTKLAIIRANIRSVLPAFRRVFFNEIAIKVDRIGK